MSNVVLTPLSLISPTVVGQTLLVDSSVVPFVVEADTNTNSVSLSFSGSTQSWTEYTLVSGKRRFEGYFQLTTMDEEVSLLFTGYGADSKVTPTLPLSVTYVKFDNSTLLAAPPTGVKVHRGRSSCRVEWATPTVEGFIGVRVLVSKDPSGITTPYTQVGSLVSRPSRTETQAITSLNQVQLNSEGTYRTTTKVENLLTYNYSSLDITSSMTGSEEFYVLLSTVVQDPATHHVFESSFNGPFKAGFVDLRKALPTDFPYLQRKEDIAGRMISEILKIYPDLDLTPRSELRDLFIDPISLELAEQSTREWFARCSESVSAMNAIDDADGDGFSDPFATNQLKQQIALAWHMSESETQSLIDKQLDLLGEKAGLSRGGSLPSVATLTVYTYNRPSKRDEITVGSTVATIPDSETPSVQFTVTGSAVIDPINADSFYDIERGWWAVTVPVQCLSNGAVGNVGAQTIRQTIYGIPDGYSVTNMTPADFGRDIESNNQYAERIQSRLIIGLDSGSKDGLRSAALGVAGVLDARVVPSGDIDMLRDWDSVNLKHTYGTVDIYIKGSSIGQETTSLPVSFGVSSEPGVYTTHQSLSVLDKNYHSLAINGYQYQSNTFFHPVEILAMRGARKLYFGVSKAQINREEGVVYLDPTELAYAMEGEGASERRAPVYLISGTPATNHQLLSYLVSDSNSFSLIGSFRTLAPLSWVPALQPVLGVSAIGGESAFSGAQSTGLSRLIKRQDPLLMGGSNRSSDEVRFDLDRSAVETVTLALPVMGEKVVTLGPGVLIGVDHRGIPTDLLSVRSTDTTTLYTYGSDYTLAPSGPYGTYTLTVPSGSTITGSSILVSYYKLPVIERVIPVSESVTLVGSSWAPLREGFISNIWMPESHNLFPLSDDGYNANPELYTGLCSIAVPRSKRYIKVVQGGVVMREGMDYLLTINGSSASIARVVSGRIKDNSSVEVTYFRNEVFTATTTYPSFVQTVGSAISEIQNGGADILIKAMTENQVDVTVTVELDPSASQSVVDPKIRTVLSQVMSQAKTRLSQAEVVRQIKSIPGVSNVSIPLSRFSKADGSYDVGRVVPTGTKWINAVNEPILSGVNYPTKTFISVSPVLPNRTIPSGGERDSYVGFLHEGLSFTRLHSIEDLELGKTPCFYIIGYGDEVKGLSIDPSYQGKIIISVPDYISDPTNYAFRVTYQVFGEDGSSDILISPCEFVRPGRISIDYILSKKSLNLF